MKTLLWLLTFFPATMLLVITGGIDFFLLTVLQKERLYENTIFCNTNLLTIVTIIILIVSIVSAIYGGIIGYKYVEMGRSRRWHYRANKYDDYNDKFRNTLYWAGKFACLPIIVAFILFMACELYYLV